MGKIQDLKKGLCQMENMTVAIMPTGSIEGTPRYMEDFNWGITDGRLVFEGDNSDFYKIDIKEIKEVILETLIVGFSMIIKLKNRMTVQVYSI